MTGFGWDLSRVVGGLLVVGVAWRVGCCLQILFVVVAVAVAAAVVADRLAYSDWPIAADNFPPKPNSNY